MQNLKGKIAVVTGGGTGMGRELCLQLVSEGCSVAACDVIMENLEETKKLCEVAAPGVKMTLHLCDVSSEAQMLKFRDEVKAAFGDKLNLLFNNAGGGGQGEHNVRSGPRRLGTHVQYMLVRRLLWRTLLHADAARGL